MRLVIQIKKVQAYDQVSTIMFYSGIESSSKRLSYCLICLFNSFHNWRRSPLISSFYDDKIHKIHQALASKEKVDELANLDDNGDNIQYLHTILEIMRSQHACDAYKSSFFL